MSWVTIGLGTYLFIIHRQVIDKASNGPFVNYGHQRWRVYAEMHILSLSIFLYENMLSAYNVTAMSKTSG